MGKHRARIYFCIFGDDFPLDDLTNDLGIAPTERYKQGEEVTRGKIVRRRLETAWFLDSDYQDANYFEVQIKKIIEPLRKNEHIINAYKKQYDLQCKIFMVLYFGEFQTPGLYLDSELIEFAHNVGAEFDIDIYNENINDEVE